MIAMAWCPVPGVRRTSRLQRPIFVFDPDRTSLGISLDTAFHLDDDRLWLVGKMTMDVGMRLRGLELGEYEAAFRDKLPF